MTPLSGLYMPPTLAQHRWVRSVDSALATGDDAGVRDACTRLVRSMRPEDIPSPNGRPLMVRYQLAQLPGIGGPRVYLCHYLQSDERHPHNSPWDLSMEMVLAGQLIEHRPGERPRTRGPGSTSEILRDVFFRVEIIEADAWTILRTGHLVGGWEFLDPRTGQRIPSRDLRGQAR